MPVRACILACTLLLCACAAPKPAASVHHADATVKIRGIKQSVHKHDRAALTQLVADLDNDDPAVRLYAIEALERITGDNFGYRYYDDLVQRQPAITRWQRWLEQEASAQ